MSDSSTNIQENFYLALQHHKEGRLKQAESMYKEILAEEPENAETLHLLGVLSTQLGNNETAIELLRKSIQQSPHFAEAHNSLGLAYKRLGRFEEAGTSFREAITANPHFDEAYNNLGGTLKEQGQFEEATTSYRQAIALNPNFTEAHINLGDILKNQNKYDEALAEYRRAAAIDPNDAETQYNLGLALANQGKHDEAETAYRHAIVINPEFAAAYNNLGNVYREQGKLNEAVAAFQRALSINPNFAVAHGNLGNTFRFQGKPNAAMDSLRRAIAIDPDFAEAYNNLGNALKEEDRQDEAEACYRRATELKPDYANAHGNLGSVLADQDKFDEAQAAYERALELDPENSSNQHMLAALTGRTPETASTEYVEELFDECSTKFDFHLLENLEYKTPALLRRELDKTRKENTRFKNAIDLGCGTGLGGKEFRDIADLLRGIDISSKMVKQAREKTIYDDLQVGDVIEFLKTGAEQYDLITSTDVFVYMGNLTPIFQAVRNCAANGAYFVFSTETLDEENPGMLGRARNWISKKGQPENTGYVLRQTGRYSHSRDYVQSLAEENGFTVESCRSANIRKDRGEWVAGDLFVLRRLAGH